MKLCIYNSINWKVKIRITKLIRRRLVKKRIKSRTSRLHNFLMKINNNPLSPLKKYLSKTNHQKTPKLSY